MRIAYAGTAAFGALVLQRLLAAGAHDVVLVVTRPDKPRGRHGTPQPSAVKEVAVAAGLPVLQPAKLAGDAVEGLLAAHPDVFVICAYGEIVRPDVLDAVPTLVVHPSALPRWRGAAPVQRALMAGETELGVAVLRMSAEVDAGPIGVTRTVSVPREADSGEAFEILAPAAVDALCETLARMQDGTIVWRPQEGTPTYARKLSKEERVIDWSRPAQEIVDQVRALSPDIGARTEFGGRDVIVWKAAVASDMPVPDDRRTRDRLLVRAADGYVEILELQSPGGRRQPTASFLRGAGRWLAAG